MEPDLWRQWQSLASQFASFGQVSPSSAQDPQGRDGSLGFAPFIESAERFTSEARSFIESSANASAPSVATAARKFSDFLRDQAAAVQPPWGAAFAVGNPSAAGAAAQWKQPALGATREHQERAQRMAEAWRRMDDAQRRMQRLWSDALREAAAAFAQRLGTAQPDAPSSEALQKLYDAWVDCAEEACARMSHSDAFCSALADHVNASSRWRGDLQAIVEQWAKKLDLPTRSEINTLARRLKSLEARLHAEAGDPEPKDPEPQEPKRQPPKRQQRKTKIAASHAPRARGRAKI